MGAAAPTAPIVNPVAPAYFNIIEDYLIFYRINLKKELLATSEGFLRNTKDNEYKMLEITTAVIKLWIRRLSSLVGTKADFSIFVKSKSL